MKNFVVNGRVISEGFTEGVTLVSKHDFSFAHGIDPKTGNICDSLHEWFGENVNNKIIIFPFGKGSLAGGLWLLESVRMGNIPKAIINKEMDPIIASGIILADFLYKVKILALDHLEEKIFDSFESGKFMRIKTMGKKINFYYYKEDDLISWNSEDIKLGNPILKLYLEPWETVDKSA